MSEPLVGRELDAAVAQRIFGKRTRLERYVESYSYPESKFLREEARITHFEQALVEELEDGNILYGAWGCEPMVVAKLVPHYADEMQLAWRVVSHLRAYWRFLFQESPGRQWRAVFSSHHFHDVSFMADDDSGPTAICRAALLAVDWRASITQVPT